MAGLECPRRSGSYNSVLQIVRDAFLLKMMTGRVIANGYPIDVFHRTRSAAVIKTAFVAHQPKSADRR